MIILRRISIVTSLSGALCFGTLVTPSAAQTTKQTAPTAAEVQVDLLRGLGDIFSLGMDALHRKAQSARI